MVAKAIANIIAASNGVKGDGLYNTQDFMPTDWVGRKKKTNKIRRQSIAEFQKHAQRYVK